MQSHTSIPLKCGTSCLFIKLKLDRVGMGRVLHLGPSWHGPSFMWAELAWAELVLGRVGLHPFSRRHFSDAFFGALRVLNKYFAKQ